MSWIHRLLWCSIILGDYYSGSASSVHKPKLSQCATWSSTGAIVVNITSNNQSFSNAFIDINDTLYVTADDGTKIRALSRCGTERTIIANLTFSNGPFVTRTGDVYVDHGNLSQVTKSSVGTGQRSVVMYVNRGCTYLFISTNNILYCSINDGHLVVTMPLNTSQSQLTAAAGTGCPGSTSDMLNQPSGIYVNTNMNLYVADTGNNRIQLFLPGQSNGTTIVEQGAARSFTLQQPTSVILDADDSLYIVDSGSQRIIRSTSETSECIIGCSDTPCSQSNLLCRPSSAMFSSDGSLYVTNLNVIQKYTLVANFCAETTIEDFQTTFQSSQITTKSHLTTIQSRPTTVEKLPIIVNSSTCFPPGVKLFPQLPDTNASLQVRRSQDFYITAIINATCAESLRMETKWSIFNCTLDCSMRADISSNIDTTFSEIYLPARSLTYGLYQFKLKVTMLEVPSMTTTESILVKVNPSGITANLVKHGTSYVTSGEHRNLTLDPGYYSINPDESEFNASDWTYEYHCRHYNSTHGGDWYLLNDKNNICFVNRKDNTPAWQYNSANASQSSVTILGGSLKADETYQFRVYMFNRRNVTLQATGFVLVKVEITRPQMIAIACVISTMCSPNLEYQYINPTTQVALYSECVGQCSSLISRYWNIYQGFNDSTTTIVKWIPFTSNLHFYGRHTSNFTAVNTLFLNNSDISFWRFEVVYTFTNETSSSALNFIINQRPENGTCWINPRTGSTSTSFQIDCDGWLDQDHIKDYSFFVGTTPSEQVMLAFTVNPTLVVRLPAGYGNGFNVTLTAHIRDELNCVREFIMESVTVVPDQTAFNTFINAIENFDNESTSNPIVQVLASGNQNIVGQVVTSLSQEFNKRNKQDLDMAVESGIPAASISVSPLGSGTTTNTTATNNGSISPEYKQNLTRLAMIRDYLMKATTDLPIMTVDSIKLLATTLAQLTKSTNELSRSASMLAANKCHQLAEHLEKIKTRVPYEDARFATNQIALCANHVLIAANAPLGSRSVYLDVSSPDENLNDVDYDSDLELFQLTLESLNDGNNISSESMRNDRIYYYQRKTANQIVQRAIATLSLLTEILHIHLNIQQNMSINSPSLFVSLETTTFESILNKSIQPVGHAQIHIPFNIQSDLDKNSSISLRSTLHSLAPYGASQSHASTNISNMISLAVLNLDGHEIRLRATTDQPFEFFIPRDPNLIMPDMIPQDATSKSSEEPSYLDLNQFLINRNLTVSLHFEIQPPDTHPGYLFIYKFDKEPILNIEKSDIDGWSLFCPRNLSKGIYTYYVDNRKTAGRTAFVFKFRELNSTDMEVLCGDESIVRPPRFNEPANFTSDYQLRIYSSGCYYLDQYNNWQSDGLWVGPLTDQYQTHCFSTHLTSFASGFLVLSPKSHGNKFAPKDNLTHTGQLQCLNKVTHPSHILESIYRRPDMNGKMCLAQVTV